MSFVILSYLYFASRKDKLFLEPVLENAEADVVERDAAEGHCAYDSFGPIGGKIEDGDDTDHHNKRQNVSEQYGFPSQSFANFHLHFVAYFHRLQHDDIHLFGLTLGRHTHRAGFASRAGAGLYDLHVRGLAVHALYNTGMSNQFIHKHKMRLQRYEIFFIYASTREHFYNFYTFFVKKCEKINFSFFTFNFSLYLCTLIWKRFFTARETRMVVGILLLLFSVIALLSYVSFLFTGTYDQDILTLDRAGRLANREAIKNMLGLPGAMLARFMIDGSFGFVSILLVFMLAIYALRMMHVLKEIRGVLLFCGGSFWVLWGSVVLGFAHNMVHQMGVFRWGGAFGEAAARWLVSYVNTIGVILILLALLVIFLIVTDPRFIDRCKAFGAWFANLFTRKPREPKDPREPSGELTIDIPVEPEMQEEREKPENEIELTIDPIQEEEPEPVVEEPVLDEEQEPLGDEPLPMVDVHIHGKLLTTI